MSVMRGRKTHATPKHHNENGIPRVRGMPFIFQRIINGCEPDKRMQCECAPCIRLSAFYPLLIRVSASPKAIR